VAFPNNKLAPNLAKQGIQMERYPRADVAVSYFAMEHPVVGGYEPHKVALRRAISLAVDVEREIRLVRRGQAIPAQGPISPEVWGYDPALKTEMSDFSRPRAKALLDMHGYTDRDGDGWREQPDGQPLLLEYATSPDQQSRQLTELWKKNMDAIGIRMEFKTAKWPEHLKASRAGKLMMWGVGWSAGAPDGDTFLALGYGPNKGQANHSRFDLPAFNELYERQRGLPDGPERQALMTQASKLMVAYMPYKVHVHRVWTDLAQPWVLGYHRNIFVREFWKYVDIDPAAFQSRGAASH
jgi:ABC-type transport system substrate-binding protein